MTNQGSSAEELSSYLDSNYTIVVAIDFGTTYSGYSFSFKKNPEDIYTPTAWGDIVGIAGSTKTPTCVLTDAKGELKAIGYKAQKQFSEMDSKKARNHRFYSHFKMKLHTEKNLTKYTEIEDQSGNKASALDIFAMVLKAIKSEMLERLTLQGVKNADVSRIRWVLTVPAIWTDGAKQFMRKAAVQAGLVEEVDSGKLILALEPEAASLCCQKLSLAEYAMRGDSSVTLSTGTKYLVLDAGGGTLDITAHKVLDGNKLEELYWANGGAMGGNRVNESFRELIEGIFEGEFMDMYRLRNPGDYNSLMNRLETVKKGFQPQEKSSSSFSLTLGMNDLYEELFHKKISGSVTGKYTKLDVKVTNGLIKIPHDVMETIFTPVVDDILSHVDDLFKKRELRGINTILMVGGFSNCAFLQQAIKMRFTKYDVLVPKEAAAAVMKGAVQFGHKPGAISARVARMTYGYKCNQPFDADRHDPDKTVTDDHGKAAKDVFVPFVEMGEQIGCDEVKTTNLFPSFKDQESVEIQFFKAFKKKPKKKAMYADDEGMTKIGSLTVDLPGKGLDRKIEVAMRFGGTEIEAHARDLREHGHVVRTTLDFLSK